MKDRPSNRPQILAPTLDQGRALDFEAVLLNVISLERLGKNEQAFHHAAAFYEPLGSPWHRLLMMLAIGRGKPNEMLSAISDKRDEEAVQQMWQLNFCFGAQFVSRYKWGEARKVYQDMLMSGVPPISCLEMALTVVEYNYLFHGSALSAFDKPIVELNVKCAEAADPAEALEFARRAFEAAKQELGTQHPAYLNAVNNLGAVYCKLGRFAEAEPYLKETVALRRAACGDHDPNVAGALNLLGALYTRLGDQQRAAECLREALALAQKPSAD